MSDQPGRIMETPDVGELGDATSRDATSRDAPSRERRPIVERLGMALIALVLATLFGGMAVASWIGGEGFLAIMAGIGALMTAWAGVMTLIRG